MHSTPRVRRVAAIVLLTGAAIVLVGSRYITASIDTFYSPDWHSNSSAEAERRGILQRRPPVVLSPFLESVGLAKADIWIEQVTHLEYPAYALWMWQREVRENRVRVVVLVPPALRTPRYRCMTWLRLGARTFAGSVGRPEGDYHKLEIDPPLPDTLHLSETLQTSC